MMDIYVAGEFLARVPAASPKAYPVLAGFEKWMVRMPCASQPTSANPAPRGLCFLVRTLEGGVASPNLPSLMLLYDTGR